jgi:trans-2,3-dihydro-3-hydroxyanthranilate isomerase
VHGETRFAFVDVFAEHPLAGNPLALVPDADHLDERQMRAIAREFNQSETTFLVRPAGAAADWRLRSFTPAGVEVLGAGHNALGAWLWLAHAGRLTAGKRNFVQQIGPDLLPVEVAHDEGAAPVVIMQQAPAVFGAVLDDRGSLADALGLAETDLLEEPAQVVSTGAGHLLVPVRSRSVVDAASPDARRLAAVLRAVTDEGCYVYSLDPHNATGASIAYARFFNPAVGIAEDPATGTAAGPLAARLAREGRLRPGATAVVEQGYRLGRPSHLRVTVANGTVRLSGSGVIAAEGTLSL